MQREKFKKLYDYCQTLKPKVKRNQVISEAKKLTNKEVRIIKATLDTTVLRGYFLCASNTEHPFVKLNGFNVIVLAHGLNDCWERFVNVKEAMHLFDDADDSTGSEDDFEKLLNDWASPAVEHGPQTSSDILGIWMALACFCPEKERLEFQALRDKGQIDDYGIALRLKIPQMYVPLLFRPIYTSLIQSVLA